MCQLCHRRWKSKKKNYKLTKEQTIKISLSQLFIHIFFSIPYFCWLKRKYWYMCISFGELLSNIFECTFYLAWHTSRKTLISGLVAYWFSNCLTCIYLIVHPNNARAHDGRIHRIQKEILSSAAIKIYCEYVYSILINFIRVQKCNTPRNEKKKMKEEKK